MCLREWQTTEGPLTLYFENLTEKEYLKEAKVVDGIGVFEADEYVYLLVLGRMQMKCKRVCYNLTEVWVDGRRFTLV